MKIKIINGKEYIATKKVRMNGRVYQEYCSANIMMPHTLYMEEKEDKLVEHWKTYFALREKYAIDRRMLSGKLILDGASCKNKATVKEQEELDKLFEQDVREFSERAAQQWGHILEKRGIQDPLKWFEQKLRGEFGYRIDPTINSPAQCDSNGIILFQSLAIAQNKLTRAHEMSHKLGSDQNRTGLMVYWSHMVRDKETGEEHKIYSENGRALNEGITNWLARQLASMPKDATYPAQTKLAGQVVDVVGDETVVEAVLFDPAILECEFNYRAGQHRLAELIHTMDNFQRLDKETNKLSSAQADKESIEEVHLACSEELKKAYAIMNDVLMARGLLR